MISPLGAQTQPRQIELIIFTLNYLTNKINTLPPQMTEILEYTTRV